MPSMIVLKNDQMAARISQETSLELPDSKVRMERIRNQVHDIYLKHWAYNRGDPHLQRFSGNYLDVDINGMTMKSLMISDLNGLTGIPQNKNRTGYENLVKQVEKPSLISLL